MTVGERRRRYNYVHSSLLCLCLSLLLGLAGCGGTSAGLSPTSPTKVLTAITASPATASLAVGSAQQFTAMATYNDGSTADVTASATWTDGDAKVATIAPSGMATGVAAGSTTITAAMGALSGSATLTVSAAPKTLSSITISPATTTIAAGATQQFAAKATYSDGSTADVTATAGWTSSNTAVATVASTGLATAVATGSTTITATVNGISGTAALTVPAPSATLTSIAVTPPTPSIAVGTTEQFTATATYSDGSTAPVTTTVIWTSTNPAAATISSAGLATAVAAGSTTVTASLNGISGNTTLTVAPSLSSVSVSPNPADIGIGATQQFAATAKYSDNSIKDVTATAAWTIDKTAVATINSAGLATGVAAGSATVTASFNGKSAGAIVNVSAVTISVTPDSPAFAMGAAQQFTATQKNPNGTTTDVTATATWTSANTEVATINANGLATGVASGLTSITATLNGVSGTTSITVTVAPGSGVDIPTWHVDNNRSGLNPNETSLTPANVAPKTFGKLFSYLVDGYAYAEPLLMSNVTIKGAVHNVLYVATENDTVYALDADKYGAPLWQQSLLQSGEVPAGGTVKPYQGITSTPVIDPSTNTIYVVSEQTSSAHPTSYRLNALDITTGQPKFGSPVIIQASVAGTNSTAVGGVVSLPPGCVQRAALLLANGTVYVGVGSCHSGWLISYDAKTLTQTGVFNSSPNVDGEGTYGGAGGIWMGSGGPVADSAGNIYVSTGNGPYDPSQSAYGDSILKFDPTLHLLDHFTPQDYDYMNCEDSDLAAGGLLMIPGSGQIVGGGKMGKLYLVNTANLGGEQASDAGAAYTLFVETGLDTPYMSTPACVDSRGSHTAMINSYEIFGTAAYFNNSIYLGVTPTSPTAQAGVRRIAYSSASGGTLTAQDFTSPSIQQNTRGTTPFISANGNSDGILWMIDEGQPLGTSTPTNATLRAYDAANLSNALYSSSTNSADQPGYGIKFTSPIVANGKVYISTGHDLTTVTNPQGEIDVYGLK
ncbi:MAG TPA: Ig-like domain-containing protein [Acidobacteriaceae bacterium]